LRPLIDTLRSAGTDNRRRVRVTDTADQHGR
jgi:hypothetical protein